MTKADIAFLVGAFVLFMGIHALLDYVDSRMTVRIKLRRLRDNRHNN